jgi:hypothetical protein
LQGLNLPFGQEGNLKNHQKFLKKAFLGDFEFVSFGKNGFSVILSFLELIERNILRLSEKNITITPPPITQSPAPLQKILSHALS